MFLNCRSIATCVVKHLMNTCLAIVEFWQVLTIPSRSVLSRLMTKPQQRIGLVILGCLSLVGCFSKSPGHLHEEIHSPYKVRVVSEEVQDSVLAVQVGVMALVPWDPDLVIVEISTIKNAERASSAYYKIGDLITRPLGVRLVPANLEVALPLQIDAKEASDYQVSLKWGADAATYLTNSPKIQIAKARFVVTESILQSVPCQANVLARVNEYGQGGDLRSCPLRYVVKGEIFNDGPGLLKEVVLGVSLVARGGGNMEGDEKRISLPQLQLPPQRSSRITINVERDLSPETASVLIPSVRVIN